MRILGIDHGERRIGLAISDPLGLIAHGLPTLKRSHEEGDFAAIGEIIADQSVTEIVVGLPKNMDDSIGPEAKRAMDFAQKLRERFDLPVHMVDERLTTAQAERSLIEADVSRKKRKGKIDRIAAQLILQIHLDQWSRTKRRET
ncbi:MAG: Holliday junction resolvase RuvX [Planctomycetes bacterium]|nr:Holliday junction resolvase RuvX [Planctomycetota bacterium]